MADDPWPDEYAQRLRRLARELPPAEVPQEVRDAVAAYEAFFAAVDALHSWRPNEGAGAAAQRIVDVLHAWTLYDVCDGFLIRPDAHIWAVAGPTGGLPAALAARAAAAPEEDFLRAALIAAAGAGGGAEGPTRMRALVEVWNDEAWARRVTAALRALGVRGAEGAVSDLRAVAARMLVSEIHKAMESDAAGAPRDLLCAAAWRAAELNPRSGKISNFWACLFTSSDLRRCHDIAAAAAARFAALR
jgi:hypothetical protein